MVIMVMVLSSRGLWISLLLTMVVNTPVALADQGLLDSKVFVGQFKEKHIRGAENDRLVFDKGSFRSDAYARRGFVEGAYTADVEQDRIYFEAVTASPSDGTITWRGVVTGDTIEVDFSLRKKGWLSDTVKDYSFKGTLAQ